MELNKNFPAVNQNLFKVSSLCLLIIIFLVKCVQAQQNVVVQWSKIYQDSVHPYFDVYSSVLDKHGNFYATGEVLTPGSPNPIRKITTVRFSSSGVLNRFDCYDSTTTGTSFGTSINVDNSGASYVAGISYPTNISTEGILLRYSANGHIDWVKHCPVYVLSCQVVLDSTGKIYLGINTDRGISISKVNRFGTTEDSVSITDTVGIAGKSIVIADSGNVYIVGNRSYCRTFGDTPMPVLYNDALIMKLDSHFHTIWKKVVLNKQVLDGQRDGCGNIVVLCQGLLSKYSSEGDSLWQKNTDNNAAYMGLAIDSHNRITIIGYGVSEFPYDAVVMYDTDGSIRWRQTLSYLPMIQYMAMTLDSADNIYIAGDLNENPSGVLCLTTKLDTAGNQIWKTTIAAAGYTYNIGGFIALDDSANVYVGSASSTQYNSAYFVIKYSQVFSDAFVKPFGGLVHSYSLAQNYPNPFNPTTTISFSLPSKSFVSLKVFDILGRDVASIISEEMSAGNYTMQWNAQGLSSGIYFYRLQAGNFTETKKLVLLQ
jgi:hypothetical protein